MRIVEPRGGAQSLLKYPRLLLGPDNVTGPLFRGLLDTLGGKVVSGIRESAGGEGFGASRVVELLCGIGEAVRCLDSFPGSIVSDAIYSGPYSALEEAFADESSEADGEPLQKRAKTAAGDVSDPRM